MSRSRCTNVPVNMSNHVVQVNKERAGRFCICSSAPFLHFPRERVKAGQSNSHRHFLQDNDEDHDNDDDEWIVIRMIVRMRMGMMNYNDFDDEDDNNDDDDGRSTG